MKPEDHDEHSSTDGSSKKAVHDDDSEEKYSAIIWVTFWFCLAFTISVGLYRCNPDLTPKERCMEYGHELQECLMLFGEGDK